MPEDSTQKGDQEPPYSPDLSATTAPLTRQPSNGSKNQYKTLQQSQASLARQQLQKQQQQQQQQAGPSSMPLARAVSSSSIDYQQPHKTRKPSIGASKSTSTRRFKYSTDDDEAEIEEDHEREYYEGYTYGLKHGRRRHITKDKKPHRASSYKDLPALRNKQDDHHHLTHGTKGKTRKASNPHLHSHSSIADIIHEISECEEHHEDRDLSELQTELIDEIEDLDETSSAVARPIEDEEDEADEYDAHGEYEQDNDNDDEGDNASISSTETFTLRERQDAINITHPFGIRIWKPALYKKDRSVQRIAEGDIHSRPGKDVTWPVWIGNICWSLSFGLILFLACTIAGTSCIMLIWSSSAYLYGKTFLSLGRYLLFPFGKCVQLWQDENYIWEDEGEGRTVAEYERWQTADIERGRLFFGPRNSDYRSPTANLSNTSSATETTAINSQEEPPARARSGSNLSSLSTSENIKRKRRLFGRGEWNIGRIVFYFWYYLLVFPLLLIISLICWLGVFSIPMAKVTTTIASHLRRHPLALSFREASVLKNLSTTEYSSSILLCTYRAYGWSYYKYTVDGTNIFFINLMFPVLFVIFDNYFLAEFLELDYFFTSQYFIFFLALAAVIPLAYFIGQAVASISAQTSMGMGAAINAFFSTIVEVYLYCVALNQGKGDLVEGSIVGSILAGVLLLPGLSMCAGAIKRKTQRYNPKSAGVSSTMLLFAVIGAFAPTIFYQIYGTYELRCAPCNSDLLGHDCSSCVFYQVPMYLGPLYTDIIKPFSAICATLLFISYVIGLWFTLRTHAALIWQTPTVSELTDQHLQQLQIQHPSPQQQPLLPLHNEAPKPTEPADCKPLKRTNSRKQQLLHQPLQTPVEPIPIDDPNLASAVAATGAAAGGHHEGGHDAPNWSRTKSTVILLSATVLYAIIAEVLVDNVDVVLKGSNISAKFLGITVFALVPNTTEFLNAISFAMNGNVSLSMEIGSAYALQVCLLQIPALVFYSQWIFESIKDPITGTSGLGSMFGTFIANGQRNIHDFMFTLIFPRWDLFMVIFCVFLFSYIYAEGKSNYFKGSILVLSYLVVMMGFYFSDKSGASLDDLTSVVTTVTGTASGGMILQHQ